MFRGRFDRVRSMIGMMNMMGMTTVRPTRGEK
jgi:hypothetical protein